MLNGISQNVAYINGAKGKYDNEFSNASIRYWANAADNFDKYVSKLNIATVQMPDLTNLSKLPQDEFEKTMQELDSDIEQLDAEFTPVEFEFKYSDSEDGQIDKMSLLGAAYVEMGEQISIDVETADMELQETLGEDFSAKVLDLNDDGEIDLAEYSTSILFEDALSYDDKDLSKDSIDGIINKEGQNESMNYYAKRNQDVAFRTYQALYQSYNLGDAQEEFLAKIDY